MSTKPENTFIASVHRKFGPRLLPYFEKNSNPWRSGTPDVYYSGDVGDLWVEYKFDPSIKAAKITKVAKLIKVPTLIKVPKLILPDLSPRQMCWLNDRHAEGRNVAVILGTPDGGVIYRNKEWCEPLSAIDLAARLQSREAIARWIHSQVGNKKCDSSALSKLLSS